MAPNPAYDMVDPIAGSFRGRLATALTLNSQGGIGPVGVSFNASGRVVVGTGGQTGLVGLLVKNVARGPVGPWGTGLHAGTPNAHAPIGVQAGDGVDIMALGTIENLDKTAFPAGSKVYVKADGTVTTEANNADKSGNILVGFTREAGTLIVRFAYGTLPVPDLP